MRFPKQQRTRHSFSRKRNFRIEEGGRKGTRHFSGHSNPGGHTYNPGDVVRETGIYEVIHSGDHRAAHDAVMLSGDVFPPCETCADAVRFRLVRTAPYIFRDQDFEDSDG